MNFSNALKLIQTLAVHSDDDLKALQSLLAMSPLPPQMEPFAPIVTEAQYAVTFLLKLDDMVLNVFSALGMTPPAKS